MTMTRSRSHRRRQAFTLLELMIVLVILVLLFAMVGPRLFGSQKKADIKAAKTQIGNLEAALELYAVDMRTFPSSEDGLQALLEPPSDERAAAKWDGPYLDDNVLPLDPWDNPYEYEYPPTQQHGGISPTSGRWVRTARRTPTTISATGGKAAARPARKRA